MPDEAPGDSPGSTSAAVGAPTPPGAVAPGGGVQPIRRVERYEDVAAQLLAQLDGAPAVPAAVTSGRDQ